VRFAGVNNGATSESVESIAPVIASWINELSRFEAARF
jgi:hypothetical protein